MNNIKIFFAICNTLLITAIYSQDTIHEYKVIANFEIMDAKKNGGNISYSILKKKYSYAFYKIPDGDYIQFAYINEVDDSQTYGPIYLITKDINSNHTAKERSVTYNFYWSYNYTQYIDKGTAKVKLVVIHKPKGMYFELSMTLENLEEYVFKGKMEGDLSLLDQEAGKTE